MHLCQNGHYYKPHRASAEKVPYLKKKKKNSRNEGKAKKRMNRKKKKELLNFLNKKKRKKTGPKCGVWVIRCRK
ncbi:AAB_G0038840.mRNA.1.CDS.1 [Saccharomyces cerevisiae]|nr:AAB_G0038840.mRNA.1.CDS.1 [Saccharomyces cerevisiae]